MAWFPLSAQEVLLRGKVFDATTEEALPFASVRLLSAMDSMLVKGVTTELDGSFQFRSIPGSYVLSIGFIGYEAHERTLEVGSRERRLGSIQLQPITENLDEVVVRGVTSGFSSDIDKRVYQVENSVLAEGANASELLNTLPSVQVDENGGISMRGSGNILIYINGRPTNMSSEETENILAQFPANSIKDVELITNPSARYDAQGVGGIINIVLKKDARLGLNGQANASIGTRDKYQAGFNLNYGYERFLFNLSYTMQQREIFELSESLRFTPGGRVSPFLDQDFDTRNRNTNHLVNFTLDYQLGEAATLSAFSRFSRNARDRSRIYEQRHQNMERLQDSLFVRTLTEDQFADNIELGSSLDWQIDSLGQKLFASMSFAHTRQERIEWFDQRFFNPFDVEDPSRLQDQIYERPIRSNLWISQLDYTRPLPGDGRLEAGLKGTFSFFRPSQRFEQLDLTTGSFVVNDTITNTFDFDEWVIGAYSSYQRAWGDFSYQVGLRLEQTFTRGEEGVSGKRYTQEYLSWFPSAYLRYTLGEENALLLNYSRRINRPSWSQFAPFYNAQDLLNTRLGNPELLPEFTDSYELGFEKGWERWLLSSTLYHRRTQQAMTRVFGLLENNGVVQLQENAAFQQDTGLELINQVQPLAVLDMTLTGNFFYTRLDGTNIQEELENSAFTWSVNLLGNWGIPRVGTLQFMADYRGPVVLPQGRVDPIWGINLGIRREVLKGKGTISLNVTDILNTRIYRVVTEDVRFSQTRLFNMETRIGTLAFTYRFGGFKSKEEKLSPTRYSDDPF
ncbi:MAG: TonB-dependent receptor domain-containing protein [Nitritalea sp.]